MKTPVFCLLMLFSAGSVSVDSSLFLVIFFFFFLLFFSLFLFELYLHQLRIWSISFFRCLMKWITEELKIGKSFFYLYLGLSKRGPCSKLPPQLTSYWLVAAAHYYTSSVP